MDPKKIFGGLFGRKEKAPEAEKNPQIQRAPRVPLQPIHKISFELDGADRKSLPIANVSVGGVGFSRAAIEQWPPTGTFLKGALLVDDKAFPVRLKLVHVSVAGAGCAFEQPIRAMVMAIHQHLSAELTALQMIYMGPDKLKEEEDGLPHWYQGENNCELHFVENAGHIVRFHLVCFGNYIEGGEGQQLRFGYVVNDERKDKPSYKGSALVRWETSLNADTLAMALRLLKTIPRLPENLREAILRLI